jgi:outer membrane lipoprotein-sorting protein
MLVTSIPLSAGGKLDEIMRKHFNAIGQSKLDKKSTLIWQGVSAAGPFTLYQKRPNKVRVDATYQGTDWIRGYDGKSAWLIAPWLNTPQAQPLTEGPQFKQLIGLSQFDGPIHHPEKVGGKLKYLGEADIDGKPGFKLELVDADGTLHHIFLYAKNYFLVKQTTFQKDAASGQEYEIVTLFQDYRKIDGIYMACKFEIISPQGTNSILVDRLILDHEIADVFFERLPTKTASH